MCIRDRIGCVRGGVDVTFVFDFSFFVASEGGVPLRYYRFAGGEGCAEETMGLSALESPGISVNVVDDVTMALLGPSRRATAAIEIMETSRRPSVASVRATRRYGPINDVNYFTALSNCFYDAN